MTGNRSNRQVGPNGQRRAGAESKLVLRRRQQEQSHRKQAATAAVAEERAKLARIIANQQHQPAMGQAVGAAYAHVTDIALHREPEAIEPPAPIAVPRTGPVWTVRRARDYLREGYTLAHVLERSGVSPYCLQDIPLDEDGRGLPG